jgi:hypothetical protein
LLGKGFSQSVGVWRLKGLLTYCILSPHPLTLDTGFFEFLRSKKILPQTLSGYQKGLVEFPEKLKIDK